MSGHKFTLLTPDVQTVDRWEQTERQLRQVEQQFSGLKEQVGRLQDEELANGVADTRRRQQEFQYALGGMGSRLHSLEDQLSQSLVEHHQMLADMGETLRSHTEEALAEQAQALHSLYAASQLEQQAEFNRLRRSLARQQMDEKRKRRIAGQAVEDAQALAEAMQRVYNPADFYPAEWQASVLALEQAQVNLDTGFSEAALINAQQATRDFSMLRISIEEYFQAHAALLATCRAQAYEMAERLERSRSVRAVDLQGSELEMGLEVDDWSAGYISELLRACRGAALDLQANGQSLLLETLHQYQGYFHDLEEVRQQTVAAARHSAIASQMRLNLAGMVLQALRQQGFELHSYGYENQDPLRGYRVQVVGPGGSEVLVQVDPTGEGLESELHLHSLDHALRTRHELRQRAHELSVALRRYGLQAGEFRTAPAGQPGLPAQRPPRPLEVKSPLRGSGKG